MDVKEAIDKRKSIRKLQDKPISDEIIKELLNIPKEYIIPFILALGYSAEDPVSRGRKELKDIVF